MHRFVNSYIVTNLMGNPCVYLCVVLITYMLNGVDEVLVTLFLLGVINTIFVFIGCWRKGYKSLTHAISKRLKMYVVICFGVIVDRVLGINSMGQIVSLRNYLILFYSHHEILELYNFLIKYEFYMPKSLKKYLKGGKKW